MLHQLILANGSLDRCIWVQRSIPRVLNDTPDDAVRAACQTPLILDEVIRATAYGCALPVTHRAASSNCADAAGATSHAVGDAGIIVAATAPTAPTLG
ncbi:hypothetical protein EYC84_007646 [Monilinia fructicola]|uniref:Uncharacterized protein n=1 Tax=Monilinia fructicola TaxID=38448 RepID=A0A5M9JNP5_MONFR|nr:hypothetical protein EYC84_007646 [Monilinia fructicola]